MQINHLMQVRWFFCVCGFNNILIYMNFFKGLVFAQLLYRKMRDFGLSFDETKMQRLENVNVTTARNQGQDYGDGIDVMHVCFVLRVFRRGRVYDV
ncbi:hypothetical protein HZU72_02725 [Halomonas sp. QX-2]|uniref:Uncharacterized protein n=1 Tax=Vreelandella sedimenti TaxID=2729618 RepID=A0A7Z0N487_9GAMM|nr:MULTISPECIES: hypothetical protein [Halomonas]NYT71340.1 hypothetical protein [Halomonas sedimenti]